MQFSKLALTPRLENLVTRLDDMRKLMMREDDNVLADANRVIEQANKLIILMNSDKSGAVFEQKVQTSLVELKSVTSSLKRNALVHAQSLDSILVDVSKKANGVVPDIQAAVSISQQEITADERCYKGEESLLELFNSLTASTMLSIQLQLEPVSIAAIAWATTMRKLAGEAANTENQLEGLSTAMPAGFADKIWTRIVAVTALQEFTGAMTVPLFWGQKCATLS